MSRSSKPSQTDIVMETGEFGHWKVIEKDKTKDRYVICECECGKVKSIRVDSLVKGDSTSCGCRPNVSYGDKYRTKTQREHPLYQVWQDMNRRCYNENRKDYKHYGGRGIEVCEEWRQKGSKGLNNFLKDMEDTFEKGLELERIDVNKGYYKDNCTWVTRKNQINNTRVNNVIEYEGISLSISEWSHLLQISQTDLWDKLFKQKHSMDQIVNNGVKFKRYFLLHKGEIKTLKQIREYENIPFNVQRQSRLDHGDTVKGLKSLGVEVEEVKSREKDYLSFEEGLSFLKEKDRDAFEDHLLYKIEKQLEDKVSE